MRTPRATLIGFGALAGLALVTAAVGLASPCAFEAGFAALLALAGALLVVEFSFSRRVLKLCGGGGADRADALQFLAEWLTTALQAEREKAADEARWRSDVRAAIATKTAASEARRAREELAEPLSLALRALADGDLTRKIDAPELSREYDAAVALYNKTVFALGTSASAIGERAREITGEAEALGERAEILGWNVAPAREALRTVAAHCDRNNAYGKVAEKAVVGLRKSMETARDALVAGAESIERIAGAKARIDEIADGVDGFVFQLRLVAVNAGVEAARAGAKGRGGKVVAQELRTLAEKTATATWELTAALGATLEDAGAAAKAMRAGASAADKAAAATHALDETVTMQAPLGEIESALDALAEATSRDAKSARDIAAASGSLETLVSKLAALAAHFRYDGAETLARAEAEVVETPPLPAQRVLPAPRATASSRSAARRLRAV